MSNSRQRLPRLSHAARASRLVRHIGVLMVLLLAATASLLAQQPQIPTLQVCNVPGSVSGGAKVHISQRTDATHSGSFNIEIKAGCDAATGYPAGGFSISGLSMNDSVLQGFFKSTSVDQITVTGRVTPTVWLSGRCSVEKATEETAGCKYWLMIANNPGKAEDPKTTPTIVSFLVFNKQGKRIAYGTGPLVSGAITVSPTSF